MRYAMIYGAIAGLGAVTAITATILFGEHGQTHSEWFGYLVMLAALSLIFVGVKRYRDVECGGVIRFGRAFAVGLGIAAVATLFYAVGWEACLAVMGYDFIDGYMADYAAGVVETMRRDGASAAAIEAQTAELKDLAVRYRDPLFRVPLTMVEILPVGLLVSLIAAALLRNPRFLAAARS